jgi:hypothetical protein
MDNVMQKYLWKVVTATVNNADPAKNAENHLNQLQSEGYEIFATHTLPTTNTGWLVIIARKPSIDDKYDRKY